MNDAESDALVSVCTKLFEKTFNESSIENAACVFAPGRVNLIGEHTDYNDGFVMPLALEKRTVGVGYLVSESGNTRCRIVSALDPDSICEFTLDDDSLRPKKDDSWALYVKGVVKQYFGDILKSTKPVGFVAAFNSNVPLGGGLSSSASLEVCTATLLEELYGITTVSRIDRALRCVKAERDYANVPCGIMDQFISSCATKGFALLIDCRTHETTKVDLSDDSVRIVITNSNKKHQLSGSEYPDRVKQCNDAVKAVNATLKTEKTHLRDVSLEELEKTNADTSLDPVVYRRARHAVTEDIRTRAAVKAAQEKDYAKFGQLMIQSHTSLRDDFEVSTPEIDFLVATAIKQAGVYGSRITGGGFGGCCVSLVSKTNVGNLIETLDKAYKEKFGIECTSFSTSLGAGAGTIWNKDCDKNEAKKARTE